MNSYRLSRNVLCLLLWGLATAVPLSSQTVLQEIAATGAVRGGVVAHDNYPFVYRQGGLWSGFEVSLMREIADELGVSLDLRTFPDRETLLDAVADGAVHIAFSKLFRDLTSSETTFQTSPVAALNLTIVVNRAVYSGMRTQGDLAADLSQGRLAVAVADEPAIFRGVSRLYPRAELTPVDDYHRLWRGVEQGEFVAIALDEASVHSYFADQPQQGIRLRVFPLPVDAAVVGLVPWTDDFFWEWINILVEGQGDPATLPSLTEIYDIE